MKDKKPTVAAMRAARHLYDVELPGKFYGLEGLAKVIDDKTQIPFAVDAFKELLNYVGGWDETKPGHPIVKAREALRRLTGSA